MRHRDARALGELAAELSRRPSASDTVRNCSAVRIVHRIVHRIGPRFADLVDPGELVLPAGAVPAI